MRKTRLPTSGYRSSSAQVRILGAFFAAVAVAAITAAAALAASLSWGPAVPVDGSAINAISCPNSSLCVAVDGAGSAFYNTTPDPGGAGNWQHYAADGGTALASVACPSQTLCVAVGAAGAIVTSATPTSSSAWGQTAPGSYPLSSVSCPSTSFCVAVDNHGGALYTQNPSSPNAWTRNVIDSTIALTSVSCASSSLCAAVDASGAILTSTNPTSAVWTHHTLDAQGTLTAIACSASGTCITVGSDADGNGATWATGNPGATDPTWSKTNVDGSAVPAAVSCTAEAFCAFGDSNHTVYSTDAPTAAPPTWSSAQPTGLGLITAIACSDGGFCAASDASGNVAFASLPYPVVLTSAATQIGQTTARLTGTVDPQDAVLTQCYFEYGRTQSYGATIPCASTPAPTGGTQSVSAQLAGLAANTTYHVQLVATTGAGTTPGGDATLRTPPPADPDPTIDGTPAVGQTLTCDAQVAIPTSAYASYAWFRDTTKIAGATSAHYLVTDADRSQHLYCTATIGGDGGTETASSSYVGIPSDTLGTVKETRVGRATEAGSTGVRAKVTCSPQATSQCAITLRLTVDIGHTASIGFARLALARGVARNVFVKLNGAGRRLLAKSGRLSASLTVSGTVVGALNATLRRQTITLVR